MIIRVFNREIGKVGLTGSGRMSGSASLVGMASAVAPSSAERLMERRMFMLYKLGRVVGCGLLKGVER